MPGLAIPTLPNTVNAVFDDNPDVNVVQAVAFYGFMLDVATGRLVVDRIAGDEAVRLPEEGKASVSDYRHWLWTTNNLAFSWDTGEYSDRLLMEVQ